jgi:hypothetical protein
MTPEVMNVIATSPILPFLALNIFLWLNSSAFMGTIYFYFYFYLIFVNSSNGFHVNCLYIFGYRIRPVRSVCVSQSLLDRLWP